MQLSAGSWQQDVKLLLLFRNICVNETRPRTELGMQLNIQPHVALEQLSLLNRNQSYDQTPQKKVTQI